jgi:ferric-dicitrate binding protein FerR (iron transport regulator)
MTAPLTANVITDLWLLQQAGEASADSRALVHEYLAQHPEMRRQFEASDRLAIAPPRVSPTAELRSLEAARENARNKLILVGGALALFGLLALAALGGGLFLVLRNS